MLAIAKIKTPSKEGLQVPDIRIGLPLKIKIRMQVNIGKSLDHVRPFFCFHIIGLMFFDQGKNGTFGRER